MRLLSSAVLASVISAGVAASAQPNATLANPGDDKKVTLTGCLVQGEHGGFLLTEAVDITTSSTTTTRPAGTSGTATTTTTTTTTTTSMHPSQVLYWLDDDDNLMALSGRKVELTGELKGDVKKGELEIERKDNGMIQLEAKSDGKKVTALLPAVPAAVGTAGAVGNKEIEIDYIVRKLDVKSARMIADSCK